MGWKNVREHYLIVHIVAVFPGKGICIGSPYVHDLIVISPDGKLHWGPLGIGENRDLARYHAEMTADLARLKALIDAPDTFGAALPVWTYDGGKIITAYCEKYGWPNCTHDGTLMYDNRFFRTEAEAVAKAKREADLGIRMAQEMIMESECTTNKRRALLAEVQAERDQLERDYPSEGKGVE